MSKVKVSIKEIERGFRKVFRCGYCDLQYIMYTSPHMYNSGVYGWNCDIYCNYQYDIAITTGYRNMAGERIPSELIEKYNKLAAEISYKDNDCLEKRYNLENELWKELNNLWIESHKK